MRKNDTKGRLSQIVSAISEKGLSQNTDSPALRILSYPFIYNIPFYVAKHIAHKIFFLKYYKYLNHSG